MKLDADTTMFEQNYIFIPYLSWREERTCM